MKSSRTESRSVENSRATVRLGLLFGAMYFVQGLGEPTAGLITQPVDSLLKSWGRSAAEIATFAAILSLPWSIKPLYGILTDFVPIPGGRRRGYLLLTSFGTALSCLYLFAFPPRNGQESAMLTVLLFTTVGVAFSDVVIDALMVEWGQSLGMTGRFQSIQWGAMYAATLIVGVLGGYLSSHGRQHVSFLVCGCFAFGSFLMAYFMVRDREDTFRSTSARHASRQLWQVARHPALLSAGAFLFLWNFNPFNQSVLYVHMTRELGMSEQFYGNTISVLSAASMAACGLYGFYCRRISFRLLLHLSVVTGILATLAYAFMSGPVSAVLVTIAVGFTYMTANLIQLDLAARVCTPETAGTTFALLMSLCNLSYSLSEALGGHLYDNLGAEYGYQTSFQVLVLVGAAFTALCWTVFPLLRRYAPEATPTSVPVS
jgi:MFS family permease